MSHNMNRKYIAWEVSQENLLKKNKYYKQFGDNAYYALENEW